MIDDMRGLAAAYFQTRKVRDLAALRSVLPDDATFRGPLGEADDAETCIQGMRGIGQIVPAGAPS
jgi:hypothetical protein